MKKVITLTIEFDIIIFCMALVFFFFSPFIFSTETKKIEEIDKRSCSARAPRLVDPANRLKLSRSPFLSMLNVDANAILIFKSPVPPTNCLDREAIFSRYKVNQKT